MCVSIERYTAGDGKAWDDFVRSSKQGTFLLQRQYMDYHADRFRDHSLMFYAKGCLVALLPANEDEDTLVSHGGLTYGGLITDSSMTTALTLEIFNALRDYGSRLFSRMIYRPTPYIYHTQPADEDLYALTRLGAQLTSREVSSAIYLPQPLKWRTLRKRGVKKAEQHGVKVCFSPEHLPAFWQILNANLTERHNVCPVHSLAELQLLHGRFPDNIRLVTAWLGEEMLGGMLLYCTPKVLHSQYIASTPLGKQLGCFDLVMREIMNRNLQMQQSGMQYLDFGKSTEQAGTWLNENLIFQKEGFGARAICYDTYTWKL